MPSGKDRKEDTWKESDLKKALKSDTVYDTLTMPPVHLQQPDDKKKYKDDRKSKEQSSHKSDDKREHREQDDNKKRRDHDDAANGEVDYRRTERDRDRQRDLDRERRRDRERDKDRERRKKDEDRDKERTRERDRDRDKRREKDTKDSERSKEKSSLDRPKEGDRSRERQREKEDVEKQRDRERRRDRDAEKSKDKEGGHERRVRHREQDRSKERHREHDRSKEKQGERDRSKDRRKEKGSDDRDREQRRDRDTKKKGERDRHERSRDRDTNREGRKDREDKYRGKERTKDGDKDKDKEQDKDRSKDREKDKERHRDRDRLKTENRDSDKDERRKSDRRDEDSERKSKHKENARETRRNDKHDRKERKEDKDRRKEQSEKSDERDKEDKIKRREDELMESLKQEEELRKEHLKFRSDTMEEADVIEEDVDQKRKASLQRMPSINTAEQIHDEENDGYDYDDDDFEDYDEDFEDDDDNGDDIKDDETSVDVQDPSRMQELLQAINAENEGARASSREGREQTKEHTETQKEKARPTMASHGRINFVAAKQKQISDKVASRTRRRGQELMRLIDLDVAAFDIFDLPPLNEYELYIKNFGRSDTKQAYVQCNEDNVEKEIQTEEIETRTKWTQNPASDAAGFGDGEDDMQEDLSSLTEKANVDSLRLSKFLQRAAQTCLILLEESISEQSNTQFKERKDMTCTDGFMQLSTKHWYLEGRPVKCVHISPVQAHFLLTAYGPVADKSQMTSKLHHSIQEKGLVCVWNTNEPSEPQKILICESTPRCCCLSPSKATLAFAGLEDGSVVAWDLREPSSMHHLSKIAERDNEVILRSPTFSTAGVLKKDESHLSPVVSLLPLIMPGGRVRASGTANLMSDDMLGLSFQLASLEENAALYLWVVVELDKTNSTGSESDLGLSPGGKVKLIKSSSIALQSPVRDFRNNFNQQALILRFLPHDPNHVYVGTDRGYVLHCDRHGGRAPPKAHGPDIDNIVRIAALDLSPWQLPCMLAGSESGDLWLFNLKNELPLLSWPVSTNGNAILSIRWSYSRPGVFYVLDSNSSLHVWDLLKSDKGPVAVEKFKHGRVTCFELSSDYSASGIGIPGRNPELVLLYESGAVEVHRISSVFSKASGDELDRFASYLDSVL